MALLWTDGTWTSPEAVGAPQWFAPIPTVNTKYAFRQDYQVFGASYYSSPTALDTAHASLTDYVLVEESELRDLGAGAHRFTRTYCKVPSAWSDYEFFNYTFPGYVGPLWDITIGFYSVPDNLPLGREPKARNVLSRLYHEYFLCATGQTYTTPGAIPKNSAQEYYGVNADCPVQYLSDSPPATYASTPSRTTYEGWVTGGTEIVAEDSRLTRFMGNIWVRRTRYVVAR